MNPTVTLAIAINLLSEDDTLNAVLAATPNARFLVMGQTDEAALTNVPGAPRWKLRELDAALSGHQTTRNIHVVKSGGRFRLTLNNADGINLAEEAELPFKSLKNFGEIVRRCFNAELEMGTAPIVAAVPEVKGSISVVLPFSSGMLSTFSDTTIAPAGASSSTFTSSSIVSDIQTFLGSLGSVIVTDPGYGTGDVTFDIALSDTIPSIEATGGISTTWNRTGYVAAVPASGGEQPNAILLDQIAGELRFVRVPSVPAGTDVATCIRPVTPESESAFLE